MSADAIKDDLRAALKRERDLRRHLRNLAAAVKVTLDAIDETMTKAESRDRGKQIASLCNGLDMSRQLAERFGLGRK